MALKGQNLVGSDKPNKWERPLHSIGPTFRPETEDPEIVRF